MQTKTQEKRWIYTLRVLPGEKVHISECTFLYGLEKEKIYDCTELLKRPTKVSDNLRSVMEKAWESWDDEEK